MEQYLAHHQRVLGQPRDHGAEAITLRATQTALQQDQRLAEFFLEGAQQLCIQRILGCESTAPDRALQPLKVLTVAHQRLQLLTPPGRSRWQTSWGQAIERMKLQSQQQLASPHRECRGVGSVHANRHALPAQQMQDKTYPCRQQRWPLGSADQSGFEVTGQQQGVIQRDKPDPDTLRDSPLCVWRFSQR